MGFWDDLTGKTASNAANAAAADQYGKQIAAADATRSAGRNFQSDVTGYANAYTPYVQGGGAAQNQVYNLLGLNGGSAQSGAYDQFRTDPGYQFQQQQGINAIDRSGAARGMTNSGATLKALDRFGQGTADQSYGNYLQRLMGLGGQGLQATGSQAGLLTQGAQGNFNANLAADQQQYGAAPTIGQGQVAGANARAAGSQNLLNAGLKLGGMVLGGVGGGSSFGGTGTGASSLGSFMSLSGSNPFNPDGTRNVMAYGLG